MSPSTTFRQWTILVALTILILTAFGCASPSNKKDLQASDEQEYIDLKLGFSLVVPSSWERVRVPVSSPLHRPNAVEWLIPNSGDPESDLQVSRITVPLQEYLSILNKGGLKLTEEMAKKTEHPAGPALRWEIEDNPEKIILLSIEGPKRRYIITCRIAAINYSQLIPSIEKVISSFTIL